MAWQTEGSHAAEFLISEGCGHISRDTVTIAAGANLASGTVLGKVTATGKYVALAPAANDGSQIAAAILWAPAPAASADKKAVVIARMAAVNDHALHWPAGITAPQKIDAIAQLAGAFIIVRS